MKINSSPKPAGNRGALIDWRLECMTKMATELKKHGWNEVEAAQEGKYIRINGESYRAVSLADSTPLCQFSQTGSDSFSAIKDHFEATPKDWDGSFLEKKRERRLQSRIIRQALIKDRNLLDESLFGDVLKSQFDELVFAFDEISFGDKNHPREDGIPNSRCDLVAVGKRGDEVFPVVIELKSERSLDILLDQLKNACKEIEEHHAKFSSLLKEVTGMKVSEKCKARKILIWPKSPSGREQKGTADKRKKHEVLFIEYDPREFTSPYEVTFSLKTY